MHIFEAEKADGLEQVLSDSAKTRPDGSVAYATTVVAPAVHSDRSDFSEVIAFLQRNLASVTSVEELLGMDQPDLALIVSVLVSTGWNKNDDVFVPGELWAARKTPINKPMNDMHDDTRILGHIVDSYPVDKAGGRIDENLEPVPDDFDIEVAGVLYRALPSLSDRIDQIIDKANSGEMFVSMEAWFTDFDYSLLNPETGETEVLERKESTAFMTKHLRIYGGSGMFMNYRIGRVLKNIIFGGQGFVEDPANVDSVIRVAANQMVDANSEGGVTGMEQELKDLQAKLEEATAALEEKDAKIVELESLSEKVEELTNSVTEAEEANKTLAEEKTEVESKLAEVTERAEKAESELEEIRKTEMARERMAKLSEVREVEDEDATLAELKEMSDETFELIMKYAGTAKSEEEVEEVEEEATEASEEVEEEEVKEEETTEAEAETEEEEPKAEEEEAKAEEEEVEESEEEESEAEAALAEAEEEDDPDFQGGTESKEDDKAKVAIATAYALLGQEQKEEE